MQVRYKCFTILNDGGKWVKEPGFFSVGSAMAARGGLGVFFKGINPTVMRDLTFGGVFTAGVR
jgi:hypothetical protein